MAIPLFRRIDTRRRFLSVGAFLCAALTPVIFGLAQGENSPAVTTSSGAAGQAVHKPVDHAPPASAAVAEPDDYRMDDYRQPVPATLAGARVISTDEAEKIWKDQSAVFIDVFPKAPKPPNLPAGTVWRDPSHMSIKGGHWLPNVGHGVLAPDVENYFKAHLDRLTAGDKAKPVLFYCLKDCWMSWNAAKRALSWGYTSVIWFPDGTDGWTEAGNDIVYLTSEQ